MISYTLTSHQAASLAYLTDYPNIPYCFLIGGFGCGKSFTDVVLLMYLQSIYAKSPTPVTIGLIGVTIKLLKQTVIKDFTSLLTASRIKFRMDQMGGTITIGNLTIVYLAMENPSEIYAHNFSLCLVDEMDELPPSKVSEVFVALQERCRVKAPAPLNRPPFMFFSTTAQGKRGTYALVTELKRKGLPYMIIRGRTKDNTNLDPSQYRLLRSLYSEEEAKAYLDGEFVNLTNGRVYHAFDEKKHVVMPFPIYSSDKIYYGADFNLSHNASVACIVRGDKIFVVDSRYWPDMGVQAYGMRDRFKENHITMIPDASGKEIMSGFREEFGRNDIDIYWNNANPGIAERILAINKLLSSGRLLIFAPPSKDKDLTSEQARLITALELRSFDDAGKPEKGKGKDAFDHLGDCLEYCIHRIIYSIEGFEDILSILSYSSTESRHTLYGRGFEVA